MSVNIDLGDKVVFTVPVDTKSGFLYGIYQDANATGVSDNSGVVVTVDLKSLLKRATDISLTNYVYFLTHDKTNINNESVILDQQLMVDCLDIYNITGDDNYFNYLLVNMHKFWTLLSLILYDPDFGINVNVLWDIHLHTPYQLLPNKLINNKLFHDNWLKLNTEKQIILNGDQNFIYTVIQSKDVNDNEHTINTITTYSHDNNHCEVQKEVLTNINNKVISEFNYYNGDLYGMFINTYPDTLTEVLIIINDEPSGPYKGYYVNGQLRHSNYCLNDNIWGTEFIFDKDGNIVGENMYHDDLRESGKQWIVTDNNKQRRLLLETTYVSGLPKRKKYIYSNGNYIISILPATSKRRDMDGSDGGDGDIWMFTDGQTMTLYDQHNIPIWEIVYGNPTKQYFFENGKLVGSDSRYDYEVYNYIDEQWKHND